MVRSLSLALGGIECRGGAKQLCGIGDHVAITATEPAVQTATASQKPLRAAESAIQRDELDPPGGGGCRRADRAGFETRVGGLFPPSTASAQLEIGSTGGPPTVVRRIDKRRCTGADAGANPKQRGRGRRRTMASGSQPIRNCHRRAVAQSPSRPS